MKRDVEKLIAELVGLADGKARLDAVAHDLSSGTLKFALIDPWSLARLLGLDPSDNGDWGRSFYVYRTRLDDLGLDQPGAENIKLLKGHIPAARYAKLESMASKAIKTGGDDIQLLKQEIEILEEQLTLEADPFSDLVHISTELETPSGDSLEFEGLVGDGGEVCELYGPYELARGEGVDLDDCVCIE